MGGYAVLVAGLGLWSVPHLLKRLAPDWRARKGDWVKGVVALLLVASIWVMTQGYRAADPVILWPRWEPLVHVNNLLTLVAVFLFVASNAGGRVQARMRHPQLTAVKVWALAHLLVNGDLASVILFGGLLAWAVVEVVLINRQKAWAPSEVPSNWYWRDGVALLIALVVYAAIAWVHIWFGLWPFGGGA